MATFPIGDDFIFNLVSSTSFTEVSDGSQGELLPRYWSAQGLLDLLPGFTSFTPILNQTSQVSVRTWPAQGLLNLLPGFTSLTPLVNQTSQVSVKTFVATNTLNLNLPNAPTCNWPTLPTTGQIWPLNNYFYEYVPAPPAPTDPIPALSPVLWYDFADESTVTTSGTAITSVTDKGSNGWTLSVGGTSPQYVTGINGNKCLDWGVSPSHANFMYNSSSTSTTIGEVYVVVDASFGGTAGNYAGLFTSYNNAWYMLAFSSSLDESGTGFNQLFVNGGTSNRFSGGLFTSPSIDNPAIMRINNSSGTAFNTTGGFEIGNDRGNSSLNRGWPGLIGEYIVFPSVLSPTDRDSVQAWLASKWGITLV